MAASLGVAVPAGALVQVGAAVPAAGAPVPALGEEGASGRGVAEIRILGRLDARTRVHVDGSAVTVLGVLTDETGVPVSGGLRVLAPTANGWESCLGDATNKSGTFRVDASGRFCLRAPPLPLETPVKLELSSESHRTRQLELSLAAPMAPPPRITGAPESVELDRAEEVVVTASAEGREDGQRAQLIIDCQGERTTVAEERVASGRVRFAVPPRALPGPNVCALHVRADSDSNPRAIVLQGRATLSTTGWSRRGARARVQIRAQLRWQDRTRTLDVGVLEVSQGRAHIFTTALSAGGWASLELDEAPEAPLTVRLTRTPLFVLPPPALTLSPPTPWAGWRVLEAAALLGLGLWLLLSWRSGPRRETEHAPSPPSGARQAERARDVVTGQVLDAHTARPLAALVELFLAGPTAEERVASTSSAGDGRFELRSPRTGLLRVHASADGYLPFQGALGPGAPVVRLVARRRAALSLLAAWFRSKSPQGAVPTPREAGQNALSKGSPGVAQWAEEVARAAYAATPPSDADLSALAERKPS